MNTKDEETRWAIRWTHKRWACFGKLVECTLFDGSTGKSNQAMLFATRRDAEYAKERMNFPGIGRKVVKVRVTVEEIE